MGAFPKALKFTRVREEPKTSQKPPNKIPLVLISIALTGSHRKRLIGVDQVHGVIGLDKPSYRSLRLYVSYTYQHVSIPVAGALVGVQMIDKGLCLYVE